MGVVIPETGIRRLITIAETSRPHLQHVILAEISVHEMAMLIYPPHAHDHLGVQHRELLFWDLCIFQPGRWATTGQQPLVRSRKCSPSVSTEELHD
jgi:hypothetical protein